jgi:beta-phosphoglucomutase
MSETSGSVAGAHEALRSFVMRDVAAVAFDWDGVLVDSSRNYYRAYELVLREIGITTTPREIYLREGQPTPQVIAALCRERGMSITDAKVKELVQRRREYDIALGKRTFFSGIRDLLARLRKSGCKLAMVTGSSRKSVELVLGPVQEKWFDAVVTADDVARPKPDPEPFLMAAKKMGVDPPKCVVVENAPFGIRAARAAGCRVVAVCTTLTSDDLREADCVVRDHKELERLFADRERCVDRPAGKGN